MKAKRSKFETKLIVLLRDFGFRVEGTTIIENAVRGFTSERVWGRCRDLFDAAERLCPVIRDNNFSDRLVRIGE